MQTNETSKLITDSIGPNTLVFAVDLAHVWPMVAGSQISLDAIVTRCRQAITDIVTEENGRVDGNPLGPETSVVFATGGDGRQDGPIHAEMICWSFD